MSYRILQILDAIRAGDISFVNAEVTRTNVNYVDPETRMSFLMWSIEAGQVPCLLLLLSRGASILLVDRLGFTVLHRAVWSGTLSMVRALLFSSPDSLVSAAAYVGTTPTIMSSSRGGKEGKPARDREGGDGPAYHSKDSLSLAPPSCAVGQGEKGKHRKLGGCGRIMREDHTEKMMVAGKSRKMRNEIEGKSRGVDPLRIRDADENESEQEDNGKESVEELLEHRQAPSLRWRKGGERLVDAVHPLTGRTALMLAAVRGNAAVVDFLVNTCGADIFLRDNDGFSAFDLAAMCGHVSILRIFLSKADGDGFGNVFPFLQQRAEVFGESAKTIHQRQILNEMNRMMSADFSRQSYVSAC